VRQPTLTHYPSTALSLLAAVLGTFLPIHAICVAAAWLPIRRVLPRVVATLLTTAAAVAVLALILLAGLALLAGLRLSGLSLPCLMLTAVVVLSAVRHLKLLR
jgi:hypothetical protein